MTRKANKGMRSILISVLIIVGVIALVGALMLISKSSKARMTDNIETVAGAQNENQSEQRMKYAIIRTEKGDMKAELFEKETPGTVANFVKLANEGFYDSLTFHRVIPGFVIQGGCPNGTGTGGPGYKIKCETSGERQYHDRGVLSMAHAGKDTGGSQFFVCHNRQNTAHLDGVHTAFGQVVEGVDIVDEIRPGDLILGIDIIEQ